MSNKISLLLFIFSTLIVFGQKDSNQDGKKDKKGNVIAIPVINYSNSFGMSLGAIASGFYHFKKNDTISPLSTSTLYAMYSSNDTWFAVQINNFYLREDTIRIETAVGLGVINFQTYFEWPSFINIPTGNLNSVTGEGEFVDYKTSVQFAYAEFLHYVAENFYIGGQLVYSHSKTEFDVITTPTEEIDQLGLGVSAELDSRDRQFSPIEGRHSKVSSLSFFEGLGSTNSYTKLNIVYNHYFPVGERNTILGRFYSDISFGDVPFSGQNIVGRDDLRGYAEGKYRCNQVYAMQSEYRHWFSKRWGYVAFGGLATAINTANDLNINNLLPAVGGGIRFLAIPKSNISIGIDAAIGKDDWGLYFRIGEAFAR